MKPTILVLGASGKTGNATAIQLLEKGYPVRAFVRINDSRAKRLKENGAEIFCGDLSNINDLTRALTGVKRAYFVVPWEINQLNIAMSFAVAAKNSTSLEAVVAISQWLANPQHPAKATRETYITDEIFSLLPNISCTTINIGWLADNYMPEDILTMVAQLGMFPFPLGSGKTAPISNEDVARVVVACLENPEQHSGKTYRPTGPTLLSPEEIADTFGKILNRKVRYQNIPDKMFFKALRMMRMSNHMQTQLKHYIHEYKIGTFEKGAPNQVFEQLTGKKPENFETIAERYISKSKTTDRKTFNKIKALLGFAKLLLTMPANLGRYEKNQGHIQLSDAQYSLYSEYWLKHHSS